MIDTKELRRLAQQVESGEAGINELVAFVESSEPKTIIELLDRLEAAENTKNNWLRANAPGGWIDDLREERDALRAALQHETDCVEAAKAEIDALRSKIEAMEKQEPVGEIQRANSTGNYICSEVWVPLPVGSKLYALPGAKGE